MKVIITPLFLVVFLALAVPCHADSPISIIVQDNHGPVGGASVAVLINGAGNTAVTGPNGIASFTLPEGNYSFTALKDGYQEESVLARVGVDNNVTITLKHLYGVSGTVVDAATGLPLAGASITVTDKVTQDYYTGATDSNGIFTVQVPNGYYSILVRAPYYYPTPRDNNGAGYQVLDNNLYVGYIPIPALNSATGNLEGVQLSCDFPGKTVKANQSVSYDVTITNNGAVDKTYQLVVKDAPSDWSVNFLSGMDVINRVSVASKGTQTFQVQTTPLNSGNYSITIMAAAASDNSSLQLFVDVVKETGYNLEFYPPGNITLDAGGNGNLDVVVKNNGTAKLTNVMLDIEPGDVPQSLTATVSTNQISELDPGESRHFTVNVYAKSNAGQETDKLYMRATSAETKTDQQYVEVTIVKSNTWIGAGIAIALVAILAFGFIVWKYGRR